MSSSKQIAKDIMLILNSVNGKAKGEEALEAVVATKRLQTLCDVVKDINKCEANKEYRRVTANIDMEKSKKVKFYDAELKGYTKPASYEWPENVTDLEKELKDAKEAAKKDGTAVEQPYTPDITKDTIFSVSADIEYPDDMDTFKEELTKSLQDAFDEVSAHPA